MVAVNTPFASMLPPPLTDHFTPDSAAPLTVEVNRNVSPAFTDALAGEGVLTPIGLTLTVAEPVLLPS
ncbi:hypothetical protein [Geothrix sp. 21YS21S-4]|uniref:hypothetical protein n=1 Tax=Geothrix sp. 21YS21S-4 TaxID=3068889 RepID=UPI0027B8933E|nr:hypothetical protein [Geothrix sp. 21YS21S-4]